MSNIEYLIVGIIIAFLLFIIKYKIDNVIVWSRSYNQGKSKVKYWILKNKKGEYTFHYKGKYALTDHRYESSYNKYLQLKLNLS